MTTDWCVWRCRYNGTALGLYPYAFEVTNFGGGYIHDKQSGVVLDARDSTHAHGQIAVQADAVRGIFAFPPSAEHPRGPLPNLAPLTGVASSYRPRVVRVTGYDMAGLGAAVLSDVSDETQRLSCTDSSDAGCAGLEGRENLRERVSPVWCNTDADRRRSKHACESTYVIEDGRHHLCVSVGQTCVKGDALDCNPAPLSEAVELGAD